MAAGSAHDLNGIALGGTGQMRCGMVRKAFRLNQLIFPVGAKCVRLQSELGRTMVIQSLLRRRVPNLLF